MKEYRIVNSDNNPQELTKKVNELLEQGWCLVGGVSVAWDNDQWEGYFQAMSKEIND